MKNLKLKQGFITVTLAIGTLLSMPFISTAWVKMSTGGQVYDEIEKVPQKEIALILGAAAYGDRLSDILKDRVETGIELYEDEKVSALIMSGAENESKAMKNYAIEEGVPEEAIIEDPSGLNTFQSIENISELDRSIIIVTQRYHLPRALFIANHMGIDAVGIIADKQAYLKIENFKKREILATAKAILDILSR